jgi:intracellular septation protein
MVLLPQRSKTAKREKHMSQRLKFFLDFLPLAGFFVGYHYYNLFAGTAAIIVLTLVSLAVTWAYEKKLAMMPLISGIMVTIFGGLTLLLHDELFIKIRPTIVNCLFAATLFIGVYAYKKPFLKYLLGTAFQLTEEGWLKLSRNWGIFFLFLAAANELVWRSFTTDFWVNYKVFGVMAMTLAFTIFQMVRMQRFVVEDNKGTDQP